MTKDTIDEYTEVEQSKLVEFRELVSDILVTENHKHDSYLIRWLRARNLDLNKAEDMLRKNMEWRKVNRIDGILEREDLPEDLKLETPMAFCGTTDEGNPILIYPMGRIDYRKALDKYGKDACNRFNVINMEKISKLLEMESEKQGRKITQVVEIIDLNGYSYRQMSTKLCRDFMIDMQRTMDSYYPELMKYAIMLNAPKVFPLLFAMMKPFAAKRTLEKFDFCGPDKEKWLPILSSKFPMEKIPERWGGTLKGKDEFCSGSEIWIQGPDNLRPFMNGLSESDAEYSVVVVNARDKVTKEFHISDVETIIEWKFKTESNDIGFQVSHCCFKKGTKDVLPYTRVDAHNSVQEGSIVCKTPGKYNIIFDNCFSFLKPKTLLYRISVVEPKQEVQECLEL